MSNKRSRAIRCIVVVLLAVGVVSAQQKEKVENGRILVTSPPDNAEVFVDRAFVGKAPATLKLNSGKHTIRVVLSGFKEWTREISILPDSDLKLVVVLEKSKSVIWLVTNVVAQDKSEICGDSSVGGRNSAACSFAMLRQAISDSTPVVAKLVDVKSVRGTVAVKLATQLIREGECGYVKSEKDFEQKFHSSCGDRLYTIMNLAVGFGIKDILERKEFPQFSRINVIDENTISVDFGGRVFTLSYEQRILRKVLTVVIYDDSDPPLLRPSTKRSS